MHTHMGRGLVIHAMRGIIKSDDEHELHLFLLVDTDTNNSSET